MAYVENIKQQTGVLVETAACYIFLSAHVTLTPQWLESGHEMETNLRMANRDLQEYKSVGITNVRSVKNNSRPMDVLLLVSCRHGNEL